MRDLLALVFIKLARKLTTWGFVEDYLYMAEDSIKDHMLNGY